MTPSDLRDVAEDELLRQYQSGETPEERDAARAELDRRRHEPRQPRSAVTRPAASRPGPLDGRSLAAGERP